MFDWSGEFNSFIVPFSPFGAPTVNRGFSPHIRDFIRALCRGRRLGRGGPGVPPASRSTRTRSSSRATASCGTTSTAARATPSPATSAARSRDDVGGPNLHCPCDGVRDHPGRQVRRDGQDANVTGPVLTVGTVVTWTYEVTNPGDDRGRCSPASLDDAGTPADPSDDFEPTYVGGDTDGDGLIDTGEVWLFRATGIVQAGPLHQPRHGRRHRRQRPGRHRHRRRGLRRLDRSSCTSPSPSTAPTPTPARCVVSVGTPLTLHLHRVDDRHRRPHRRRRDRRQRHDRHHRPTTSPPCPSSSRDYNIGDTDRDGLLDPGELWRYVSPDERSARRAAPATTSTSASSRPATATTTLFAADTARVRGTTGIRIEKFVNGVDADTAPGPSLPIGSTVVWTYEVHNESGTRRSDRSSSSTTAARTPRFTPTLRRRRHQRQRAARPERGLDATRRPPRIAVRGPYVNIGHGHRADARPATPSPTTTSPTTSASAPDLVVEEGHQRRRSAAPRQLRGRRLRRLSPVIVTIGSTVTFTYLVYAVGGALDHQRDARRRQRHRQRRPTTSLPIYVSRRHRRRRRARCRARSGCTGRPASAVAGQYTNIATATGLLAGESMTDTDPANYYGDDVPKVQHREGRQRGQPDRTDRRRRRRTARPPPRSSPRARPSCGPTWCRTSRPRSLKSILVVDDNGTPGDTSDDFAPVYVSGDSNGNGDLEQQRGLAVHVGRRPLRSPPPRACTATAPP